VTWMSQRTCPICGAEGFDPDCDEVDIGVGVQEFGFRGRCVKCGEIAQCDTCGKWCSEADPACKCGGVE